MHKTHPVYYERHIFDDINIKTMNEDIPEYTAKYVNI